MIKPNTPNNERERLEALNRFSILDTLPEADYDSITRIASFICGTSISLVSLIDSGRQWFKSRHGLKVTETPRDYAFCAHAINSPNEIMIVHDSRQDERFIGNPLVEGDPHVIFYAGVPLVTDDGYPLGTLCVIDQNPKEMTSEQIECLKSLARQIMIILKLRETNFINQRFIKKQNEMLEHLDQFANVAAHDLKSPLNNIIGCIDLVKSTKDKSRNSKHLDNIRFSARALKNSIDGLLDLCRADIDICQPTNIDLGEMLLEIEREFVNQFPVIVKMEFDITTFTGHEHALKSVFRNLMSNAIRYSYKDHVEIKIQSVLEDKELKITFTDNGPGIKIEEHEKIFEIFSTISSYDRFGEKSSGIGLATSRKLIEKCQGSIVYDDSYKYGACFVIRYPYTDF